jgi:uncharacterized membrane protein YqjE
MADQTTMTGGNGRRNPSKAVVHSVADLAHDIATLAELQAKLAAVDLRDTASKAMRSCVKLGAGLALMLAALPVILMGVAYLLVDAGLSTWLAFLLTGVGAAGLAAVIAFVATTQLRHSFEAFQRSREEFVKNLQWVKGVLVERGEFVPPGSC